MTEHGGSSRPQLPSVEGSRAVIIGVSEYTRLEQLPSVANNVAVLGELLTDRQLWGLPFAHCVVLHNPATVDEVLDAVHAAAAEATEALVVYFAGHGLLDDRSDLYLALPDADNGRLHRAVRYDDVRREVVSTALRCRGKVMILDCCYSGRAMLGGMSGAVDVADQARIDGTYLMTASAETKLAVAPIGERFTAFTGAFIHALDNGIPDGPELLGLETIYWHVRAEMQAKQHPVPQQRTRNDGKDIAIVRNRAGLTASGVTSPKVDRRPAVPPGFERLLSLPPVELLQLVDDLRGEEQPVIASQVLVAAAARRPDQEVAAVIGLLRRLHRHHDAQLALAGAALRAPGEIISLITALRETGQEGEIDYILTSAGKAPAEHVTALAAALKTSDHAEATTFLLDAAVAELKTTADIIGLVAALSVAEIPEHVDHLLHHAMEHLSNTEAVQLADALRGVGRQQAAFRLYLDAVDETARRSGNAIAELTAAMHHADSPNTSLVETATAQRSTVAEFLDLIQAFNAHGQQEAGELVLAAAALRFGTAEALALAAELRAGGQYDAALRLCVSAAAHKPIEETRLVVAALRDAGRPVDANKVLTVMVRQRRAKVV